MKRLESPSADLGDLKAEAVAGLLEWSADVVLVLDGQARVIDAAGQAETVDPGELRRWKGKLWADLVTQESRGKLLALLDAAMQLEPMQSSARSKSRAAERASEQREGRLSEAKPSASQNEALMIWRQLNHPTREGSLPISYRVRRLHEDGPWIAIGRSMQSVSKLQQQFVQSQQQVEREFTRLRDLETRYRLLFQHSEDPLMLLDAHSLRILEANAACAEHFQWSGKRLANKSLGSALDAKGQRSIRNQIEQLRASGQAESVRVRHAKRKDEFLASVQAIRQDGQIHVLLRLSPEAAMQSAERGQSQATLAWFEHSPDAIVICTTQGDIQRANPAFLEMVRLAHEGLVRGESLARWLGRGVVDLDVLISGLKQSRSLRHYLTTLSSEFSSPIDVEIAAAYLDEQAKSLGLTLRASANRNSSGASRGPAMSRSMEQLSELVGSVSLKDLVRESTDVIERLCI
ncbi:MAG: transcriptional regulator PpsR, partial [Betaproteobacteria bacterium]|nr:transcriptional regulator PpsR [Betaproteobacteria bacterium]